MAGTALVTGGTVRLGLAIADELRGRGWRVLVSSHRPDAGADIVADLADPLGPARLYAAALRLLDGRPPDAVVNNAALFTGTPDALEAVNLVAPRKLTALAAGREEGLGAVVNVCDCQALSGAAEGLSPYLRTKRLLAEETRRAALTFAATLRVNAVAPGPVLAPAGLHVRAGELLLDRRPTPADVAAAVAFLLENQAVTGTIIPVDAGQSLL